MDTPAEFRKYAADCETMAKVSRDPETQAVWKRMAERRLLCAGLAEHQDLYQRRRKEEKSSKLQPRRRPHRWKLRESSNLFF
jgi:hypothetical protein